MPPSALLAFEAQYPRHTPAKRHAIMTRLNLTEARYYQLLLRAADSLDGIAADPITARRVRERERPPRADDGSRFAHILPTLTV